MQPTTLNMKNTENMKGGKPCAIFAGVRRVSAAERLKTEYVQDVQSRLRNAIARKFARFAAIR